MHSSINNGINTTELTPVMSILEKIISIIAPFRCLGCGRDGELVCGDCVNKDFTEYGEPLSKSFGLIYALYVYDSLAADLVKALKFDRAKHAAYVMAQHLDDKLPHANWGVVTFVPTAPKRARARGYDQAELIARHFARMRGLSCERLLVRASQVRQVGSDRSQRQKQIEGAFLSSRTALSEHILIIDDVMTTGSTLDEACGVLKSAGVLRADGAVFAATK